MSWRGRGDRGASRWAEQDKKWTENRTRSPVWELRRSPTPPRDCRSPQRDRYRNRHDRERYERDRDIDRDRRDRYDRDSDRYRGPERYRDRYDRNRDRDRDRERRRSPRGHDDRDIPMPPSPPNISADSNDKFVSRSRSRSDSRERYDSDSRDSRDRNEDPSALNAFPGDWICKCGSYNFKRRQTCFRHNCNGKKSEGVTYSVEAERAGVVEPTSGITKRLLFRRLDALTTEERILDTLKERCSKSLIDSIAGIIVGRETLTSASKCLAYINFNSVADSMAAHSELFKLNPPLEIDNREVLISFYNEPQKPQKPSVKNTDYSSYYGHPQNYSNSQCLSEADRVNAAAAVAQSAISAAHARQMSWTPVSAPTFSSSSSQNNSTSKLPTGDGKTTYTAPDTRTFMYDESSGYYYDPATGLYYDGNTQYFYNNQTNQYMYWDASSSTYILASQTQQNTDQPKLPNPPQATVENTITKEPPEEKKKKDKEDKVKVAKKIAKDMERWARTLNQKKENARSNIVMEQPLDTGASKGSADIGFSVLGAGPSLNHVKELSPSPTTSADNFLLKNSAPETEFESDEGIIDWVKLTCLLCKRKFPSADVLTKHKSMSDLHIKNLTEYRKKNEMMPQTNCYRDRAAERRMKFGEDEIPMVRRRYESDVHSSVQSHPPPSVVDTIGGKMLQKMGWSEGKGLGKEGQGRIAPIEAEQRPGLAGLGQKRGIYTPTPGETYRDTVKKLMIARYKEVIGQEETTD